MAKPRRRARRAARPPPTLTYSNRRLLEQRARLRGTRLLANVDEGCGICTHPFARTGEDARLVLFGSGYVYHASCAAECCRQQRRREVAMRADHYENDAQHPPTTGYRCEFSRQPLTAEEVGALELPAWPGNGEGWLVDDRVDDGEDDLCDLVQYDDVDAFAALLARTNFTPNYIMTDSFKGDSLLMMAIRLHAPAIVDWLVDHGADVHFHGPHDTEWGRKIPIVLRAAQMAIVTTSSHVLERILRAGANVTYVEDPVVAEEGVGNTVWLSAFFYSEVLDEDEEDVWDPPTARFLVEVVELLLKYGAGEVIDRGYRPTLSALMDLAKHTNIVPAMELLVNAGAEVDAYHVNTGTALHVATYEPHYDCIKFLLQHGACTNLRVREGACGHYSLVEGYTPLMLATKQGHAVVALLLEHDAVVDAETECGHTALMLAAKQDHVAVVALLLKHGAAVDKVNKDGETALMLAAKQGHEAVVKLLLEYGAAVGKVDKDGRTAAMLARDNNHTHLVALLERAEAEA
jgi:hypothetical protein